MSVANQPAAEALAAPLPPALDGSTEPGWASPSVLHRLRAKKLRLRFSERKILLTLGDLLSLNAALAIYLLARYSVEPDRIQLGTVWLDFLVITLIWACVNQFLEGTKLGDAASFSASQWAAGKNVLLTSLIFYALPVLTPMPTRRYQLIILPAAAIYGVTLWRGAFLKLFALRALYQRVLVIGAGVAGQKLIQDVAKVYGPAEKPGYLGGHWVLGFIDDHPAKRGTAVEGIPVLGSHKELASLVRAQEIDELILAITRAESISLSMFHAICDCREQGITVTAMHGFYEHVTGRVPVELAGHNLHMVMPLESPQAPRFFTLTKRMIDIFFGAVGSLIVLGLMPLIWLANRLTAPGPLFYTQPRVGHGGIIFKVIKFRSMIVNAEKATGGAVWAQKNDPRITLVGHFLRKSRLDEFPQFWNVFIGNMSLIGPRPERPEFVDQLAKTIPFFRMRHAVKPGITGWAQVRYPYGASQEDALMKLQYDLYYIKHQGPFLEFRIVLKTLMVILGLQGR